MNAQQMSRIIAELEHTNHKLNVRVRSLKEQNKRLREVIFTINPDLVEENREKRMAMLIWLRERFGLIWVLERMTNQFKPEQYNDFRDYIDRVITQDIKVRGIGPVWRDKLASAMLEENEQ